MHWLAPVAATAAVAALVGIGYLIGQRVELYVRAPPFMGRWEPLLTWRFLPPVAMAAAIVAAGPALAARLGWRWLLALAAAAAGIWWVVLGATEGWHRIAAPLDTRFEYLHAVPTMESPAAFLDTFLERWREHPLHVRGHPPGMVLVLWAIDRLGFRGPGWAASFVIAVGASVVPAVMMAVRTAADEASARRAAPFLVLMPAAVWAVTSADGFFMGVAAWMVALVVIATGQRGIRSVALAVAAGLLAGACLLFSYGLVLIGAVPLVVIIARRRWDTLVIAGTVAAAVVLALVPFGFWYLDGLQATHTEIFGGVAAVRPYRWWVFVNLIVFSAVVGPAGLAGLVALARRGWRRLQSDGLAMLVAGGLIAVLLADVSGMSKSEVERIWLPFAPWIVAAAAALRRPSPYPWLAASAATAITLQFLLRSPW